MTKSQTTEITTSHPTRWGEDYNGLRELTLTSELRHSPSIPRRYDVYVSGERIGWVTGQTRWSACTPPADGVSLGTRVVDGCRTRAEAIHELLVHLRNQPGPVQDAIVALWTT